MGHALIPNHALHGRPLGEVLYELTGRTDAALLAELERQPNVTPGPSLRHLIRWTSILRSSPCATAPTCFCTSNTTDFTMERIGNVPIATPAGLPDDYAL